ncbi:MAG: hypothetical protein HY308_15725 [Gammaproteobacteria bacterium]|nr:hypothetical protein [Gammaproteobacteria bacterium]
MISLLTACGGGGGGDGGGGGGGQTNPPPTASADSYLVDRGGALTISAPGVLTNDTGAGLSAVLVHAASHGTLTLNANGSFNYTHDGSASADSFTYKAQNTNGASAETTVTIGFDLPPVASNACQSIIDNQNEVVGNLTVSAGNNLTYSIVGQPANGTVQTTPAGVFMYQPKANATGLRGMDKFTFEARDARGRSSTGTITILNKGEWRIMPLGDSITAGKMANDLPTIGTRIGYRRKLYRDMHALSSTVVFVGSKVDGEVTDADYEFYKNHQGIDGGCAKAPCFIDGKSMDTIDVNIINWLSATPADVILLHIGTNDLGNLDATGVAGRVDGVRVALDKIDEWQKANHPMTVFLARIIGDVPGFSSDRPVADFNNQVAAMVANRGSKGPSVLLVDMYAGAGINYGSGTPPTGDMSDNYHPNEVGYEKMANKWKADLTNTSNVGPKYLGLPTCP